MSRGASAAKKTEIRSLVSRLMTILTVGPEINICLVLRISGIHKQNTVFCFHVQFSDPVRAEKVFDLDLVYEVVASAAFVPLLNAFQRVGELTRTCGENQQLIGCVRVVGWHKENSI